MVIKILEPTTATPSKLADVELHFTEGPLAGLKLIGFAVWASRRAPGAAATVTVPSRQYAVNGERRSFALLRPSGDVDPTLKPQDRIRDLILAAYAAYENGDRVPQVVEELVVR